MIPPESRESGATRSQKMEKDVSRGLNIRVKPELETINFQANRRNQQALATFIRSLKSPLQGQAKEKRNIYVYILF